MHLHNVALPHHKPICTDTNIILVSQAKLAFTNASLPHNNYQFHLHLHYNDQSLAAASQ